MDHEDDEDEAAAGYVLDENDAALLVLVGRVLERAVSGSRASWAQRATIAKLLHVVCRLPAESSPVTLEVTFTSRRQHFAEVEVYFWLTVGIEGDALTVQYGGHYYRPATGGDTFTVFQWYATPGERAEWIDNTRSLSIVPGLADPADALHSIAAEMDNYTVEVIDDDNPLLGDAPAYKAALTTLSASATVVDAEEPEPPGDNGESDEDPVPRPLVIEPVTDADRRLLARLGPSALQRRSAGSAIGVECCDGCGIELASVGLFIDGDSKRSGWGNYCASCSAIIGVEVGWGKGQLYARQPDGSWQGIAGFR